MRQALSFQPDHARLYNTLGVMLAETGDLEAAAKEFKTALEIDPQNPQALGNMGKILARQGQTEKAEAKRRMGHLASNVAQPFPAWALQ